jgi:hypothetical protein
VIGSPSTAKPGSGGKKGFGAGPRVLPARQIFLSLPDILAGNFLRRRGTAMSNRNLRQASVDVRRLAKAQQQVRLDALYRSLACLSEPYRKPLDFSAAASAAPAPACPRGNGSNVFHITGRPLGFLDVL